MNLEEMLQDNQRMIAGCTGLLRRLEELSIAIAESQQQQLERHGDILQRLAEEQLATDHRLDRHDDVLQRLAESHLATNHELDRLAEAQQAFAEAQQASDRRLDRVIELLERFLRGQTGDGHQA